MIRIHKMYFLLKVNKSKYINKIYSYKKDFYLLKKKIKI